MRLACFRFIRLGAAGNCVLCSTTLPIIPSLPVLPSLPSLALLPLLPSLTFLTLLPSLALLASLA